jgi:pilus assembly protein Flp/PilA
MQVQPRGCCPIRRPGANTRWSSRIRYFKREKGGLKRFQPASPVRPKIPKEGPLKSLCKFLVTLHKDQSGQGLVEYLLILALVALAATAGMQTLASGINSAFSALSSILGTYIT